jgi:NADH dehydrogenase (ubiquinone) Fe-S protein 1
MRVNLQHLGDSADVLKQLASGQHPFSKKLAAAKKPMIILGSEQLKREDGAAILSLSQQIAASAKVLF